MMRFYWLTLGVICVWRFTHLLQAEDGPWNIVVWLHRSVKTGFWASLLDCFYCLSLWVAAPFAFLISEQWGERLLLWPTLSAGAILLERITNDRRSVQPALYFEEEEKEDALLRQSETPVNRSESSTR